MTDLDYLKLNKPAKTLYDLKRFLAALPGRVLGGVKGLFLVIVSFFKGIGLAVFDLITTFINGDWKTRVAYFVMGFGSCARGQWGRGILFFLFQTIAPFSSRRFSASVCESPCNVLLLI